jgi:hypothetical protein
MSTWINWPPDDIKTTFPPAYFDGDPLEMLFGGIQSETCQKCGFAVQWVSDKYDFEKYNEETRLRIKQRLDYQSKHGECPQHPKPPLL